MPKVRPDPTQEYMRLKWNALIKLATESGFDDDAIDNTDHCLMTFFNDIVEQCAKVAEQQGRNYSGENNEQTGCNAAAHAIRTYGKKLGN